MNESLAEMTTIRVVLQGLYLPVNWRLQLHRYGHNITHVALALNESCIKKCHGGGLKRAASVRVLLGQLIS